MKNRFMTKLIACITALLTLCLASSASADMLEDIRNSGKLRVGVDSKLIPFVFWNIDKDTKEQTLAGPDIELAKAVAEAIGVDIEFSDQIFAGLLTSLSVGETDIVCSNVSVRDERKEVVDFSDPYYYCEDILVIRAEDSEKYKSPADLAGKKIGVVAGSSQMMLREKQFPDAHEVMLQALPILYLELANGNVDGILVPDSSLPQYYPLYDGKITRSSIVTENTEDPIAIAVRKGDNASLLEKINEVIADFIKDDGYKKELEKCSKIELASKTA